MAGTIRWTRKQWGQFLKKKGLGDILDNKQLTRRVKILEKQVEFQRAWMASIVGKLKKGEF